MGTARTLVVTKGTVDVYNEKAPGHRHGAPVNSKVFRMGQNVLDLVLFKL
jgi:hypothetical protein